MRRIRFALFDLFVVTLGVAAGLAYHRVPDVRWTDAVLMSCAAWIIVGMLQQAHSAWLVWKVLPKADGTLRSGAALAFARPLAVIAMLLTAIAFEAVKGNDEKQRAGERDVLAYLALDDFTSSLVSLAIICAYTSPGRRIHQPAPSVKRTSRAAFDLVALAIGAVWLLYVLISTQTISGLVHLAIRGVEAHLPTRWLGKPFHPFDLQIELKREFFVRAVFAAIAALLSAISTFLLISSWNRRSIRRLLIAAAAVGICIAAYEAHWYWTIGYPQMSPFLAQFTLTQPWYVIAAAFSVVAAACFLFVMRFVPEENYGPAQWIESLRAYHLSGAAMGLLLIAMVANGMPAWWDTDATSWLVGFGFAGPFTELRDWRESGARLLDLPQALWRVVSGVLSYWVGEPKMLLRFASILVVARQFPRQRRSTLCTEPVTRVRASKALTIAALAAATLLVAIPAGAWLGFAIVTTTFGKL